MLTTQLISNFGEYWAGALHITLTLMKTIDPGFEEGAIAFYENELGFFPCWIVDRKSKTPDEPHIYEVITDRGHLLEIPAFELWTGWEEDFPERSQIDWRRYTHWTEEQVVEFFADDHRDSHWNSHQEWEPDMDYYLALVEEWEREQERAAFLA